MSKRGETQQEIEEGDRAADIHFQRVKICVCEHSDVDERLRRNQFTQQSEQLDRNFIRLRAALSNQQLTGGYWTCSCNDTSGAYDPQNEPLQEGRFE